MKINKMNFQKSKDFKKRTTTITTIIITTTITTTIITINHNSQNYKNLL